MFGEGTSFSQLCAHICGGGEQANSACTEINRRLWEKAYTVAYSILENHEDAEDATNRAILKCCSCKYVRELKDANKLPGWLTTVVKNEALAILKQRWRERDHLSYDDAAESIPANESNPETKEIEGQEVNEIRKFIDKLSPAEREVVRWRLAGYKFAEIARKLRRSPSTVKVQWWRAKAKLRAQSERAASLCEKCRTCHQKTAAAKLRRAQPGL